MSKSANNNKRRPDAEDHGAPRWPAHWWLAGYRAPGEHHAQLDAAGRWPGAMVGLRAHAFRPAEPASAPSGWWLSNAPLTGQFMRVKIAFVQNKQAITQRHLQNIGPTDVSVASGVALQAALAAQLRGGA